MSRLRYPPFYRRELYDMREVEKRAEMTTSQICDALNAGEMPVPWFGEIPGSPIWLKEEIEAWLTRHDH